MKEIQQEVCFNKDKNLPTRQKFMDILKDLNDKQTKYDGLTNNTSYSLTRNILDGINEPEDITKAGGNLMK